MTTVTNLVGYALALAGAGLMAAEPIARWWVRRQGLYYVFPPGLRLHFHLDREVFPDIELNTRFEINSEGERGNEVPSRTAGLYRVLVAGGSQVEGFFLDQDVTWPGALQIELDAPEQRARLGASKVHVGNIARSGVGSEALDLIFKHVLPRYPRLQLIVISIGASDVMRWLEQGTPRTLEPVRVPDVFRCHPEDQFRWKIGRLAAEELVLRARRRWLRPVNVHERAGTWIGDARAMRARAKEILPTVPAPSPMLDHFERYFRSALERAAAHADRVLVIPQPWFDKEYTGQEIARMWHGGAGAVWQQEVTTYYAFDVFGKLMVALNERAVRVAKASGLEVLDLMPVLDSSLKTYYDCAHFTPAGARAAAAAVASAILREESSCADLLVS